MTEELILLFISIIAIITGVSLWQRGEHLLANGKKAKAIIFKNNYYSSQDGGSYYPVVRFLTDKQEWITQELKIGFSPPKKEGTKVEVRYDPDNPSTVEINSIFQLEILPMLFVAVGIFGLLELLDVTQLINE